MTEETATPSGFDDVYQSEWRAIVALGWSLTGSRQVAEELAQDAFLDAYRRWDEIGGYDKPGAWVRRAVCNRATSLARRGAVASAGLARLAALPAAHGSPHSESVDPDDTFWEAVRSLPERQAQCIALHYLEDRSVVEVATILECSANTVKVHLHRGRLTLAERLGLTRSTAPDPEEA
jgi:RNA polymerase sigma-70 factor (ECF subfamily)